MRLKIGQAIYKDAKIIFPYCRSITGKDTYKTLVFLSRSLKNFKIKKIKSGTKIYDWIVPKVWNIYQAFIENLSGKKIIDFKDNNLHVVGYSQNVNRNISLQELKRHLHTLKDQPKAIPYVTSYYKNYWGFCIQ